MSFSDNFLKELEKRKKKIDNAAVFSPYSSKSGKEAEKAKENSKNSNQWGFSDEFWEEIDRRADKVDRATLSGDDDEDIAPVRSDKKGVRSGSFSAEAVAEREASKKRTWFEKGAFSDGYDFGDITKTVLGTGRNIRENLISGLLGIAEKTVDAGATLVGGVGKLFGADGFADNMQGFVQKDLINEDKLAKNIAYNSASISDRILVGRDVEDESVLGEKSDSLVQSGGQLVGQIGLQAVGVPWYVTSGATSFGSEAEQAFKDGANYGEAVGSALVSAGAEILTEKLTGGSGLGEKGLINVDAFTKGIANKTVKTMLDFGIDVLGEGAEEVMSSVFSRLGTKLYKEESIGELLFSEEAIDEYLEGFIGGAVLGGGMNVGKVYSSVKNKTDYRSGLTSNEQAVVDKEVEKRIAEAEKEKGEKLTNKEKAEIQDRVEKDLEKGYISTDAIEEVLGGESYKTYQDTVAKENALKTEKKAIDDEFKTLNQMKIGERTGEQSDRLEELRAKRKELGLKVAEMDKTSERDFLQRKYKNEVEEIAKGDRLIESYNERARRGQAFEADVSKYKGKARQTIENLINSKSVNNTNRTHEFADSLAKYSEDQDLEVEFTNNAQLKADKNNHKLLKNFTADGNTKVFDLKMKNIDDDYAPVVTVNGEVVDNFDVDYKNGTVTFVEAPNGDVSIEYRKVSLINGFLKGGKLVLNMDSPQAWTFTVGHEVAHAIEGSKESDEYRKAIIEYAKIKGDYDSRYESRKNLYNDGTDIDGEIVADLTGEYILNDVDFIQNLATNHQNVFQKIYNEIKHMLKLVTAGSKEARQLERAKHNFKKAYRASAEAKSQAADIDSKMDGSDDVQHSMTVTDEEIIEFLENQEHITTYKAMQVIDGKLYPPMAAKVKDANGKYQLTNPSEIGVWQQATEDPTNIKKFKNGVGYYTLNKGNGKSLDAAYNPYEHSSNLVLNDQFEEAYNRPNIVTVECVIPASEMTSGYKAEHAKDGTGLLDWKAGTVASKLKNNQRKVYLSRWLKPVRILSDAETASMYKDIVGDVAVPFNVVPPGLLTELEKAGVNIDYEGSPNYKSHQKKKADTQYSMNDGIDKYSQKQYNDFGWARHAEAITKNELDDLYSKLQEKGSLKKFVQSGYGEAIIEVNDDPHAKLGVNNVLAFVTGTKNNPTINKVVRFQVETETEMEAIKEQLYERGTFSYTYYSFLREEGFAREYRKKSAIDYNEYSQTVRSGSSRGNGNEANRGRGFEQDGRGTPGETSSDEIAPTKEASSTDGVFFDGKNEIQHSLSDSDGNALSDGQREYFKDSKAVDRNGNLLKVYHTTKNDFTVFDDSKKGSTTEGYNTYLGHFFTDNPDYMSEFPDFEGGKTKAYYLNMKNPIDMNNISREAFLDIVEVTGGDVTEAAEVFDRMYAEEVERAKFRNGTPALELSNLLEELTGEYFFDTEFHNALRPNYDKLIAKGYDGVINNMDGAGWANEYVVLNSNQAKLTTNTNPTSDPDILRSLTDENDTYGRNGTSLRDLRVDDIAPIRDDVASVTKTEQDTFSDDYEPMTEEQADMMENEILDSITDEDAPPEVDTPYDVQRDTGKIEDKPLKKISDKASEYLGLNRYERAMFENIVQNYSQNENLDRDYLFSQIKKNFSVREDITVDEDIRQMKKDIKSMRIFVSDAVKGDFGKGKDGYIKFLRSNFGKMRIVKDATSGIEVDSVYEELNSLYPSYFPEDIAHPAERLRQIASVAGMSAEVSFPIEVSEAEIQEVADMVYIGVAEYMNDSRLEAAEASKAPYSDTDVPLIESDVETENKVLTVREMYEQKKQNYRDSLEAFEVGREKSLANFNEAIGKKLNEYNSLKDKNTKRANTLLQQIENLRLRRDNVQVDYADRIAKQQARLENFESKDFSEFENKVLTVRRKDIHGKIIEDTKAQYEAQGLDFDEVLKNAKDLSTFATVDNIPQRVMEKALGWKEGHILSDITVNKVAQKETEGIKWLNTITDKKNGLIAQLVKQYGIKPGSKESAAAQMYAEGFYVDKNNDIIKYGDAELKADFPDGKVRKNIKALSKDQRIRAFYDETLKAINESRARNAYPEIQKLENYFLHFRAMDDTFSRLGLPFNPNDIRAKDLPTDLNGVTADLKPGQPYFASANHRMGQRTSFDLLGGLERYATSAKNQIYHIDDIQTLRAIRNYIADTYGQAKGLDNLDSLTEEEVQERIKDVYGSHLSTFAKFLNEEANVLAGKTALIDRGLEGIIGRRAMTFMDTVNRQVGSNMVGYNVSSALTNLIAPVQAFAKTNKADFIKGFAQTVSNKIKSIKGDGDSFTDESPVVIRRKGAERYYRTAWQKLSDPGYALMGAVDNFSTELIARAKYNELTRQGMDSETAHVETDKWVSRLMGDRSLGQMPHLYNSKVLGLLTKYQLEVRNQLDSQFYDTIKEVNASTEDIENGLHRNAKRAAKITSTFFTLAVGQHLFGKAFESIAGYNPAFDIISVLIKTLGLDDDDESEDTFLDNIEQGFFELMGDMPYTSILEGGRIPISSALPIEELYKGKDQYGNEKSRWETVLETLPYYTMPGGYGQLKKTTQGLGMFDYDLPVSGSYTDSGKLRFPVEDTLLNRVQAGIFGQYASENARDYFDNERKALGEKQIQEFVDSGISIQDYWEYREGLSGLKTLNEKADYINSLDLPIEVKNLFINNLSDRKEDIDLSGMGGYSDFNEYDFATKNPEKYEWLKANGISVAEYEGSDEETKEEYDFAFKYPEKYVVSKAVGGYRSYKSYSSDLYDLKADKDEDGKSISGSRKEKVIDYINNMDADYGQKIILFKTEYPADDTYNNDIIEYLNEREDISYEEMVTILRELGFTVKGNQVYWD